MPVPERHDKDLLRTANIFEFRSLAGCSGYMEAAFRPTVFIEASMLGRTFLAPTFAFANKANGALTFLKVNR